MAVSKADLSVRWSKQENALVYDGSSPTGGLLAGVFERITLGEMNGDVCGTECYRNGIKARIRDGQHPDFAASAARTLAKELESRGYDVTTLRFSIRKQRERPLPVPPRSPGKPPLATIGQTYHLITVIDRIEPDIRGNGIPARYDCRCNACGGLFVAKGSDVVHRRIRLCCQPRLRTRNMTI